MLSLSSSDVSPFTVASFEFVDPLTQFPGRLVGMDRDAYRDLEPEAGSGKPSAPGA